MKQEINEIRELGDIGMVSLCIVSFKRNAPDKGKRATKVTPTDPNSEWVEKEAYSVDGSRPPVVAPSLYDTPAELETDERNQGRETGCTKWADIHLLGLLQTKLSGLIEEQILGVGPAIALNCNSSNQIDCTELTFQAKDNK
eukprot:3861838-Rhodomonas_salina.1